MWKKLLLVALVLGVAVAGAAWVYRYRLFAPDFDKVGGTELVFEVDEREKDPPLEDLCSALKRRFDPTGVAGLVVQPDGDRRVVIRVPHGDDHDGLVELVKGAAGIRGRLVFRILANRPDDKYAIEAAEEYFKSPQAAGELERAEKHNEPPPPPRSRIGQRAFPVALPLEPPHTYSWIELGKSEVFSLHLDQDTLEKDPAKKSQVLAAMTRGETFEWGRGDNLFFVRSIHTWDVRSARDRDLGKKREYFMLVRDQLPGQEVSGDYLTQVEESKSTRGGRAIAFRFNHAGGELFYDLTSKNKPTGEFDSPDVFYRYMAIIFDDQVLSAARLNTPIRQNGEITGTFTQEEVDYLIRVLRAGSLPVRLRPEPVRERVVEPAR